MRIVYKGYKVVQDPTNHHVEIFDQTGQVVFHSQPGKERTAEELKKTVDLYLMFSKTLADKEES